MNERLPYEEELAMQLEELHLPDENVAWEDMRRRLEKDKDDDSVIIPPPVKGCLGYGLLLLLIATVLFFVFRTNKPGESLKSKPVDSVATTADHNTPPGVNLAEKAAGDSNKPVSKTTYKNDTIFSIEKVHTDSSFNSVERDNKTKDLFSVKRTIIHEKAKTSNEIQRPGIDNDKRHARKSNNHKVSIKEKGNLKTNISGESQIADPDSVTIANPAVTNDILSKNDVSKLRDTLINNSDSLVKTEIKNNNDSAIEKTTTNSSDKRQIYFAAGIGLYQQLPVSGQKLVPYNSLGRKGNLADYIPSVYFRMYKDRRWFIQSEFRYGAPQNTKEIIYKQQKQIDTFTQTTITTATKVKKTYYHQLPLSFNYIILPGLSVGGGVTWNKFSSAVLDNEFKVTNNVTQQDSIKVNTVSYSRKADSNFVTSYFQALFETQYEWKRLSIGARYSFGLEPYIKFQLPGGQKQEEKNSSLQIFIRYNLWESRKDKK